MKTNFEVFQFVRKQLDSKGKSPSLYTMLNLFIINNNLSENQRNFIEDVKNKESGPSALTGYFLYNGYPEETEYSERPKKVSIKKFKQDYYHWKKEAQFIAGTKMLGEEFEEFENQISKLEKDRRRKWLPRNMLLQYRAFQERY